MKKLFVLALLVLSAFAASAAEPPAVPAPATVVAPAVATEAAPAPVQPDLAVVPGIPAPRLVSTCNDICIADFKICRDSCHSLACYNQCRAALDVCQAGC